MTTLTRIAITSVLSLLLSFTVQAHNGKHHRKKKTRTKVVVVKKPRIHHAHNSIRILPLNHKVILHNGVKYYRYNNTYYTSQNGLYVVVNPPKALIVIR